MPKFSSQVIQLWDLFNSTRWVSEAKWRAAWGRSSSAPSSSNPEWEYPRGSPERSTRTAQRYTLFRLLNSGGNAGMVRATKAAQEVVPLLAVDLTALFEWKG